VFPVTFECSHTTCEDCALKWLRQKRVRRCCCCSIASPEANPMWLID